jgi:hypothetical protein
MLVAVPYLPPHKVIEAFEIMKEENKNPTAADPIFKYFEDTNTVTSSGLPVSICNDSRLSGAKFNWR